MSLNVAPLPTQAQACHAGTRILVGSAVLPWSLAWMVEMVFSRLGCRQHFLLNIDLFLRYSHIETLFIIEGSSAAADCMMVS